MVVVVVAGGILLDGVIGTSVAFDDVAVVICAGAVLGGAGDDGTASLSPLLVPLLFKNPPDARIDHFIAEGGWLGGAAGFNVLDSDVGVLVFEFVDRETNFFFGVSDLLTGFIPGGPWAGAEAGGAGGSPLRAGALEGAGLTFSGVFAVTDLAGFGDIDFSFFSSTFSSCTDNPLKDETTSLDNNSLDSRSRDS